MRDEIDRRIRTVHFVLPGFTSVPFGGYKVVYEYANALAANSANRVFIHQSKAFLREPGDRRMRLVTLRSAKAWMNSVISRRPHRPIPWFDIDERVAVNNCIGFPKIADTDNTVVVATSVHTAPFVANLVKRPNTRGVYFIQSFEDWAAPKDFVESTWRLPLHLIVIAPWLAEIGNALGVETHTVLNSVDPVNFPDGPRLAARHKSVLGLVSTLPLKRTDLLIAVFEEIRAADPEVKFSTFGTCDRPEGLPAWVEHHKSPSSKDLSRLYQRARVYICASDLEGSALPPAEALLSGTAVVSTDIGGVRVYASDSALFSPPGDRSGLTRNALKLLDDVELAQRLVDRGRHFLIGNTPTVAASHFEHQLNVALRTGQADGYRLRETE